MNLRCAALLAFAAFSISGVVSPASAQKLGETIDVGGWKVSMSTNKDGSTGCTALYQYDDKSIIGFSADNDDTHMFLVSEPTAKMTEGKQFNMTYRIDKGKPIPGLGVAASTTMLVSPMIGDVQAIYKAFMAGNSLFITMGNEEFEEPLDGSSDAINALGECFKNLPPRGKK
jgi:hypothetical protein